MSRDTAGELVRWLDAGDSRIGQILLRHVVEGWELRHYDDAARNDLALHTNPEDARPLANLDDSGAYRPLKTAPNLRHGWRLVLPDAASLRLALDYFYPAMAGVWLAWRTGELPPVHLRETLGRQTGMYRVTAKITDEQAQTLIAATCNSERGCLKTILWQLDDARPICGLPQEKFTPATGANLPLLCHEACNLLVAAARKVVKGEA